MARISMSLEGFEATQRALKTAPEMVSAQSAIAITASAEAIAARARDMVPFASGTLWSSIVVDRTYASVLQGGVGISSKDAYYWRFVEFGTKYMPARPFFRPAAEAEQNTYVDRFRQIGARLEREFGSLR